MGKGAKIWGGVESAAELLALSHHVADSLKEILPVVGVGVGAAAAGLPVAWVVGPLGLLIACRIARIKGEKRERFEEGHFRNLVTSVLKETIEEYRVTNRVQTFQFDQVRDLIREQTKTEAEWFRTNRGLAVRDKQEIVAALGQNMAELLKLRGRRDLFAGVTLRLPEAREVHEENRLRFDQRLIPLFGRTVLLEQLRGFLETPKDLSWWLLTGPGGVGKSRVALELCWDAISDGWDAGFLSSLDSPKWHGWEPLKPTLIVVDSVISRSKEDWPGILAELGGSKFEFPVRFLFIDRPQSAEFWDEFFSSAKPYKERFFGEWHSRDSRDGKADAVFQALNVEGLDDDDLQRVLRFSAESFADRRDVSFGREVDWDAEVGAYRRLDELGRPLFAAIAGELLAERGSFSGYRLGELSAHVVQRFLDDWRSSGVDEKHLNLLLLATIGGDLHLDSDEYLAAQASLGDILPAEYDDKQTRLLASMSSDWDANSPVLPRLLPDPIGEAFAICLLKGERMGGVGGNKPGWKRQAQSILAEACKHFEKQVGEFTHRLATDYLESIGCLEATSILDCSATEFADLAVLKDFRALRTLNLWGSQVSDVSTLKDLTSLTTLDLSDTQVSDLAALKDLTSLTGLGLSYTLVSDVSALKDLTSLTGLDLSDTQVSDVSALKDLTSLTTLNLWATQVSDVSALKDLTSLTTLDLSSTQVSDVSTLEDLTSLTTLDLSGTQVSDVSALKDLTSLRDLYLSRTQVSDVSVLKDLTSLTSLFLSNTQVSDVSSLKDLTSLTTLDLSGTQVSDVSGLKDLTSLTTLGLSYTLVSDVSALKDLTSLTTLDLSSTQVSDVSTLEDLTSLTTLDLSGTQVSDVSALKDLTSLRDLYLSRTQVSDVSVLKDLTSLTSLFLSNTQVSDVSALKDLTSLETLDLESTQVSDVSVFKDLTSLRELDLENTQVSDVSGLEHLESLEISR